MKEYLKKRRVFSISALILKLSEKCRSFISFRMIKNIKERVAIIFMWQNVVRENIHPYMSKFKCSLLVSCKIIIRFGFKINK